MILPGMGEMTLPPTSAAAPRRSHLRGTAFLNSYASPSSHIVMTYKTVSLYQEEVESNTEGLLPIFL